MVCDICNKNVATVHLTQMIGGKTKKVDLCEACSKEKGVDDPTGFSLADLLLGLGTPSAPVPASEPESAGTDGHCPRCGFSDADFKKTGRLGCAECYKVFAPALDGLLKPMHKGIRHVGKVLGGRSRGLDVAERLKVLQKRLEKAVHEEAFEQAAALRDEIRVLKEGTPKAG